MSDFANYRRDLAVLEPAGSRAPQIVHNPPSTAASFMQQVAPWMVGGTAGGGGGTASTMTAGTGGSNGNTNGSHPISPTHASANGGQMVTTFYNDSSDNLSSGSQMSPGFRAASVNALRPGPTQNPPGSDSPEVAFFNDERRPSVASVTTTASSQASKSSGHRGGMRKLQGFFGEEFPGRDSSETSLPPSFAGKETRSHSYSHTPRPHRDRNYSNATDHTRDASPSSSRPRTPVPAPEVVPFLYQEAEVRLLTIPRPCLRPHSTERPVRAPEPYPVCQNLNSPLLYPQHLELAGPDTLQLNPAIRSDSSLQLILLFPPITIGPPPLSSSSTKSLRTGHCAIR